MRLSEWLDTQVELAVTKTKADPSRAAQIDANQALLGAVYDAVIIIDERLERIEARLGIDAPNVVTKPGR